MCVHFCVERLQIFKLKKEKKASNKHQRAPATTTARSVNECRMQVTLSEVINTIPFALQCNRNHSLDCCATPCHANQTNKDITGINETKCTSYFIVGFYIYVHYTMVQCTINWSRLRACVRVCTYACVCACIGACLGLAHNFSIRCATNKCIYRIIENEMYLSYNNHIYLLRMIPGLFSFFHASFFCALHFAHRCAIDP